MVTDRHIQAPVFTSKNVCSFTGKERDAETGYSYFGARYYDSDLSGLFLSVDPKADKYPSISPYSYCAWNPVRLVDPDGKTWETENDKKKANKKIKDSKYIINDLKTYQTELQKTLESNTLSEYKRSEKEYELSEIENQITLLSDLINGINELSDSDVRYTLKPSRAAINKVKRHATPGMLYVINFQSNNDGNLVHEMTHAIQVDRMEHDRIKEMSLIDMECGAYSTQFSFSPKSMPNSDSSEIPSSRISADWVRKVYYFDNGKHYPYEDL